MKKCYKFIILLFVLISGCSNNSVINNATIIFDTSVHDFGKLEFNSQGYYSFTFANPGKNPLIIQNVNTSCGCTMAEWTRKPVNPGEKGTIDITYEASSIGTFNRTVTVSYNGKYSPVRLTIKGKVTLSK